MDFDVSKTTVLFVKLNSNAVLCEARIYNTVKNKDLDIDCSAARSFEEHFALF